MGEQQAATGNRILCLHFQPLHLHHVPSGDRAARFAELKLRPSPQLFAKPF
jgi:hypothetical protein